MGSVELVVPIGFAHRPRTLADRSRGERSGEETNPDLFVEDPVHRVDVLADRIWIGAANVCLEAALAFGSPQLFESIDIEAMTTGWIARFGSPDSP
jgi:hypothetical protein